MFFSHSHFNPLQIFLQILGILRSSSFLIVLICARWTHLKITCSPRLAFPICSIMWLSKAPVSTLAWPKFDTQKKSKIRHSYSLAALAWGRVLQDSFAVYKHNSVHAEIILALLRRCRSNATLIVMCMPKDGTSPRHCRGNATLIVMCVPKDGASSRRCRSNATLIVMCMPKDSASPRHCRGDATLIVICMPKDVANALCHWHVHRL